MDLKNLHEELTASFKERNKQYDIMIGNNLLACSLITGKILFQHNLKNLINIWLHLTENNNIKSEYQQLLIDVEQNYCPSLFSFGYELDKFLAEITETELNNIVQFATNNLTTNISDVLEITEALNNKIMGSEIDDLLKLIITDKNQLEIFTYGIRITNYISDIRFYKFCSYNLDKYRWREALTCKILLQRNDSVILDSFPHQLEDETIYDYGLISGNQPISIEEWEHLANKYAYQQNISYYSDLIKWCKKNDFSELPNEQFLSQQIPNTDLFYSDLLNGLAKIKPHGKLYVLIRSKTWQADQLYPLRKFLVVNSLIEQIIFVKTNRLNPWILLTLSIKNCQNAQEIYMLNENFYTDQSLRYVFSDKLKLRLAARINKQQISSKISGFINHRLIKYLKYNLDPNVCLNFENIVPDSQSSGSLTLQELCSTIFRGTDLSNKELSSVEITNGYYMIGQSAITEDGFKPENLTPISKNIYDQNEKGYAVYPFDLVTLASTTTNKIVFIPETAPYCIANNNIYIIRPNRNIVNPIYLYLLLTSNYGKALFSVLEKGVGLKSLKSIGIKALKQLQVNIPSLTCQEQVAKKFLDTYNTYQKAKYEYKKKLDKCYSELVIYSVS